MANINDLIKNGVLPKNLVKASDETVIQIAKINEDGTASEYEDYAAVNVSVQENIMSQRTFLLNAKPKSKILVGPGTNVIQIAGLMGLGKLYTDEYVNIRIDDKVYHMCVLSNYGSSANVGDLAIYENVVFECGYYEEESSEK
jgi:hypothetical protein